MMVYDDFLSQLGTVYTYKTAFQFKIPVLGMLNPRILGLKIRLGSRDSRCWDC